MQPILIYDDDGGPNGGKLKIILEELGIPYTEKILSFPEMKEAPYEAINPNGRVPAITDPNTSITMWEVCYFKVSEMSPH